MPLPPQPQFRSILHTHMLREVRNLTPKRESVHNGTDARVERGQSGCGR